MTKQRSGDSRSTEAAVRWRRRLGEEDASTLSPEELSSWAAWVADPENRDRFREASRVWEVCDAPSLRVALPTDAEIAADEYDGSVPVSEWLASKKTDQDDLPQRKWHPVPRLLHP